MVCPLQKPVVPVTDDVAKQNKPQIFQINQILLFLLSLSTQVSKVVMFFKTSNYQAISSPSNLRGGIVAQQFKYSHRYNRKLTCSIF